MPNPVASRTSGLRRKVEDALMSAAVDNDSLAFSFEFFSLTLPVAIVIDVFARVCLCVL